MTVSRRTSKILVDMAMFLLLPLLCGGKTLGLAFHEVAGLCILGLIGFHVFLNWKWICGVTARLLQEVLPSKTRYIYLLDMLLMASFVIASLSGMRISRVLLSGSRDPFWRELHLFSSSVSLILAGVHLGLHWSFVASFLKGIVHLPQKIARPLQVGLVVLLLVLGLYHLTLSNLPRWLAIPFGIETQPKGYTSLRSGQSSGYGEFSNGRERGVEKETFNPGRHLRVQDNFLETAVVTFTTHMSIIGLFAVPAYYLEKSWRKGRKTV